MKNEGYIRLGLGFRGQSGSITPNNGETKRKRKWTTKRKLLRRVVLALASKTRRYGKGKSKLLFGGLGFGEWKRECKLQYSLNPKP